MSIEGTPRLDGGWRRVESGGLPIYAASGMLAVPWLAQGFTTRLGGVGAAPYDTLNLSFACGDDPAAVATNRSRVAAAFGFDPDGLAFAAQVHGRDVAVIQTPPAADAPLPVADALVTDAPGVLLTLLFADCAPVYIVEPERRVVALLHSGWRGTAQNIVAAATEVLRKRFGIEPSNCLTAVGPSIAGENYEVGDEVAHSFPAGADLAGGAVAEARSGQPGKWSLHARRAITAQLIACGYPAGSLSVSAEDTFALEDEFFSHRRESRKGVPTGRNAAVLGVRVG